MTRLCLLLIAVLVAAPVSAATPPKSKSSSLSAAEKGKINGFLARYRLTHKNPEKLAEVARDAIAAGPAANAAVLAAINRDLAPELTKYTARFSLKAAELLKKRAGKVDRREIRTLRDTVLDLSKSPEFSKELITAKGDPAMKRLEEIFAMDRQTVLDAAPELEEPRKRLFELGRPWEQCSAASWEQAEADGRSKDPPTVEKYLQSEEEWAVLQASPMDTVTRNVLAANEKLAARLDPEEARAVLALNLMRNLLGLPVLAIDLKLAEAARGHSKDMMERNFFAHESPVEGKKTWRDRAKLCGTSASGENLYKGRADGKIANDGWFHSPGYHKNMLANHVRVGVGRQGGCFTELFGR